MLKKVIESPFLNLLSGLILLVTAGYETIITIDEKTVGAHHGVLLFGLIQFAKALPDVMHGLHEIDSVVEKTPS